MRQGMAAAGLDAMLLSLGADLPWLTGYEAMPLERLTMLVVPLDETPVLVVPQLEAPRVEEDPAIFALRPWSESEDPVRLVADLVGARRRLAIADRTWATFVLGLQSVMPGATWQRASTITGPLRAVKDDAEIDALAAASGAADRVAAALIGGQIPLIGRTERAVSAHIGRLLVDEGHQRVNFAIVGGGPNSASPHHEAGGRVIGSAESVVCDFGGTMGGYCSDITRTVFTGSPPAEFVELYSVLEEAQAHAVAGSQVGARCESVDAIARQEITAAGYGDAFIHRTGHGIGLEEHEDPYIVTGNREVLQAGNVFSVEPGIYLSGRYGARIEDIVVAANDGPRPLNSVCHRLTCLDG